MADETGSGASLVERAKGLLIAPDAEWDRIDAEPATVGEIFTRWLVILALIPAVAGLIGQLLFGGMTVLGVTVRPSPSWLIANAVISYALSLTGVFLYALLIDALAPTFNGTSNRVQAMKVAAYAATPAFLAGIFGLIPQLAVLMVIGALYSLYLLYLGLPKLMKVPADKTIPYIATVIVAGILLVLVASLIIGPIVGSVAPTPIPSVVIT
jgi:hypothetical protein